MVKAAEGNFAQETETMTETMEFRLVRARLLPQKRAPAAIPILPVLRDRWSPRSFLGREVPERTLHALLEAARWAPSSNNEQPWRFIVATKEQPALFDRVLGCLDPANQEWAHRAPVLMLTAARTRFSRNDKPNRHAYHDVGLAMGNLLAQATALDLVVHQMAGIQPEHAREEFGVPEDFDVVAGVAVGYVGGPELLEDDKRRRAELAERTRKPLVELAFAESWGETARFLEGSD